MFILNNSNEYAHSKRYGKNAFFDLSEKQVNNANNSDWHSLKLGDVACSIRGSHKMSTIYIVTSIDKSEENGEITYFATGEVIAKFDNETGYTETLNRHNVSHDKLKDNKFRIGFNIANLDSQLDSSKVVVKDGSIKTVAELKESLRTKI